MNSIRAGVKPIGANGFENADEAVAAVQVQWIEIDGVRVPGNVIDMKWEGNGTDVHSVTVRFICSKFETVPYSEDIGT